VIKKPGTNSDPISIIIRLNFLFLGLLIVGYSLYHLKTFGAPTWFSAFTGESVSTKSYITLCETRVSGFIKPNAYKISQEGRKWLKDDGSHREIDFLSMERWFGANCKIQVEDLKTAGLSPTGEPSLFVQFITNNSAPLFQTPGGAYVWQGKQFYSKALDQALLQLDQLPTRPAPSSP
jgi:hypothetical protein